MQFDLERQALIASGLGEENRIAEYLGKLCSLSEQFVAQESLPSSALTRARGLFDWLWKNRPTRYRHQGNYRLNHVIDAQINEGTPTVGNCLGLTLLYNCLLRRIGIEAEAVYLENAFGLGPHLLTLLNIGDDSIDIENILPGGFDYMGHRNEPSRVIWGDRELVADIYHSVGNELFEKGEFPEALRTYNRSLKLNPHYERAILNKAIVLDRINMLK